MMKTSDCWTPEVHRKILECTAGGLWRFIQKNARLAEIEDLCANTANLSKRDLRLLTSIHFLLHPAVEHFLNYTAPKILYGLSKTSSRERYILRGAVRGRIDIAATTKIRAASGGESSVFVSWDKSPHFDLPENCLLKYLLLKISDLAGQTVGQPLECEAVSQEECSKWSDDVQVLGNKAYKLLKNVYLKRVGAVYEISEDLIEKAEKARGHWYGDLAETARLYLKAVNNSWSFLREVLKKRFFEPLSWDVLYELCILFEVLEAAEAQGWKIIGAGLIGGTTRTVSEYMRDGEMLRIYYQHLPSDMADSSRYGKLLNSYGLEAGLRRPDIVLERINGQVKKFCIIEVKRSASKQYLADGAYKLMGYLKDFEDCMNNFSGIKGILVGWSGLKGIPQTAGADNEIVLASKTTFKREIAEALDA